MIRRCAYYYLRVVVKVPTPMVFTSARAINENQMGDGVKEAVNLHLFVEEKAGVSRSLRTVANFDDMINSIEQ